MRFILESRRENGIPTLHLYRCRPDGNRPVVFLIHWYTGRKENMLELAYKYASEDCYVILYDSPHHGELEDTEFANLRQLEKDSKMPDAVAESAGFIESIIRENQDSLQGDFNRIALVGFSMGGMIIYQYLATCLSGRVKAAVPCISTPVLEPAYRAYVASTPGAQEFFDENRLKKIAQTQPSNFIANLGELPLLMIIGGEDHEVSVEEMKSFHRRLLPEYKNASRLRLEIQEDVGHSVTEKSHRLILDWIKQYV